jgi:hypothetical protein
MAGVCGKVLDLSGLQERCLFWLCCHFASVLRQGCLIMYLYMKDRLLAPSTARGTDSFVHGRLLPVLLLLLLIFSISSRV